MKNKGIQLSILASLLLGIAFTFLAMKAAPPRKIVFFGDSITQFGLKPDGYITMLKDLQKKESKTDQYELIGEGIGGNQAPDLFLRMESDVLAHIPTDVVLWVGINDVWHKDYGLGVRLSKFKEFYNAIIKKCQKNNINVVCVTPTTIGEKWDGTEPHDQGLDEYAQVIRDIAKENNCAVIDLRKVFRDYESKNNPKQENKGILTLDGCHLNATGNKLVADTFKKELGL